MTASLLGCRNEHVSGNAEQSVTQNGLFEIANWETGPILPRNWRGQTFVLRAKTGQFANQIGLTVHRVRPNKFAQDAFDEVAEQLGSEHHLVGIINAGFFDEKSSDIYSYYQSVHPTSGTLISRLNRANTLPSGAAFFRPCLRWQGYGKVLSFLGQRAKIDWPTFLNERVSNIACAGPMLVTEGRILHESSAQFGGFHPSVRSDGADPLSLESRRARSAVCVSMRDDIVFFATLPDSLGMSMANLSRKMIELGCREAMALDGGSSTQFHAVLEGKVFSSGGSGLLSRKREVPVWLAVSYR